MKRSLNKLADTVFDLVVVGGGIYGACVVWDAILRGLSVALVERQDFGSGTSANSLKIIHGGLRYLQHADFKRMRESIQERRVLMTIAPHLVHPLPVIVPTYGHGIKGREAMAIALSINDLISCDRNQNLSDPQKQIPAGQILSRSDCLKHLPGIKAEGLTGGARFYDAQVYNSERLLLAFLNSAAQRGATLANYVEVTGFIQSDQAIAGVKVKDSLTGTPFEIQAKTVINTCGPWGNRFFRMLNRERSDISYAKAMNLVTRPLFQDYAVGISSPSTYQDNDAVIHKGSRFLFIVPWRDRSLVGTAYFPFTEHPDEFEVTEQDIQQFLAEVNQAYPTAALTRADVSFVHGGLLPCSGINPKTKDIQLTKHYQFFDHQADGVQGLLSISGVKYTTARQVAEKAVDWIFTSTGQPPPQSRSAQTILYGGQIDRFEAFLRYEMQKWSSQLAENSIRRLLYTYGSAYPNVLQHLDTAPPGPGVTIPDHAILEAEALHGVREEMAQTLSDVVFRRTELGSAAQPNETELRLCAETMAVELFWDQGRIQQEIQQVQARFGGQSSIAIPR